MLSRETNWPDKPVERLLELLGAAASDDREALTRVVLVPTGSADEWRPYFIRIDGARPGDPPPVEPDDLGPVRVLVERTSVAEIADRLAGYYEDDTSGDLDLGGTVVSHPFDDGWYKRFFGAQKARAWGVHWPFDQLSVRIVDQPPYPLGGLHGNVYGSAKELDSIFPRISGFPVYHPGGDARVGTAQLYVWDYRGRISRCFVRNARLQCRIERAPEVTPRVGAFASPGERPLPIGDLGEVMGADIPDDTKCVDVQLMLQGEKLDNCHVHPEPDEQVLPDGTPLPGARSCQLLKLFVPPRSTIWPLSEPFLRRRLCETIKEAITAFELRALLHGLERDGLVQKHVMDVQPQDPGLPGLPKPGEPGWEATGTGLKAAALGSCPQGAVAPWSLGEERLVDQVVLAVGRGARFAHQIDGSCPVSTTADVEAAVRGAIDRGDVEEEKAGWYRLTDPGVALRGQLEDELREQVVAAAQPQAASPNFREPQPEPLRATPAFVRDAGLRRIIERDLGELAVALEQRAHKTTLLLAGSIAEAMLLDVLDRNAVIAKTHLKGNQSWPDSASLAVLVGIARGTTAQLADGTSRALLSQTAAGMVDAITEHRDLIHPFAEVRDDIEVDATTAKTMVHFLDVVARDLQKASDVGALDAYERGETA